MEITIQTKQDDVQWKVFKDTNQDLHVLPVINGERQSNHIMSPYCPCEPEIQENDTSLSTIYIHNYINFN
jgi:hypothetical protein